MSKKILISNQHGALVMALLPFLYAQSQAPFVWQSVCLLASWLALYLMAYPFLALFKGRNLAFYAKWSAFYGLLALLFFLPAVFYNERILYFACALLPFLAVNIYFIKRKKERALVNDVASILLFAVGSMGAYFFSAREVNGIFWQVGLYPSLFFFGTTLYVKSMLRERKNKAYLWASRIFHVICVSLFCAVGQDHLAFAFAPALFRAIYFPYKKLSAKQVGLFELAFSLWFFVFLVYEF